MQTTWLCHLHINHTDKHRWMYVTNKYTHAHTLQYQFTAVTVSVICLHSCIHSLSRENRAVLQYLNCWGRLAMCLALSQPQDDLHSHLSRQHGSLWRGGGGWRERRERRAGRRVVMFPFCPLAAFLCVPGSETDPLSHRKSWGRRRPLKVNKAKGFKEGHF